MDDISIFMDKNSIPDNKELESGLNSTHKIWKQIIKMVLNKYPNGIQEWNYPGKKYGWSYRIKDKKRAIIYLLPREKYFKVAFVFGDKALRKILESDISKSIKEDLLNARKYAEGRGVSIDIIDNGLMGDIEKLVDIKLNT